VVISQRLEGLNHFFRGLALEIVQQFSIQDPFLL